MDGLDKLLDHLATRAWIEDDVGEDEAKAAIVARVGQLEQYAERLKEVLHEARLQIEYLHSRSETTSTGVAVLSRIEAALAAEGEDRNA